MARLQVKAEQFVFLTSLLFITAVMSGLRSQYKLKHETAESLGPMFHRKLLDESSCNVNQSGFCFQQECVFSPFDAVKACCLSINETVQEDSSCLAQSGNECKLRDLCVAELLPGGSGAADCLLSWELNNGVGILVYVLILLYLFLAIAIVADDYFTASLDRIGTALGLSEDVVGATFAAAGSSAPEFFVSLTDNVVAAEPKSFGIGTIIGSAVFNVLIIIGLSALFAKLPKGSPPGTPMKVDYRPLTRDSAFYVASIVLLTIVLLNEKVDWYEGLILTAAYAPYVLFMAYNKKIYKKIGFGSNRGLDVQTVENAGQELDEDEEITINQKSLPSRRLSAALGSFRDFDEDKGKIESYWDNLRWPLYEGTGSENESYFRRALSHWDVLLWKRLYFILVFPINLCFRVTIPDSDHDIFKEDKPGKTENRRINYSLEFTTCVLWIGILAYLLVYAAAKLGCLIGVPPEVMGLTVLAAGTSVPDTLTSVLVARQGKFDMAIANALGSNVFNIFIGLGIPWFLGALKLGQAIPTEAADLLYSVLFLIVTLSISILLLKCSDWCLSKRYGLLLLMLYAIYIVIEILKILYPSTISTRVDINVFN